MPALFPTPPDYDPFSQSVLFTIPVNASVARAIPIPTSAINAWNQYSVRICINYASQLGATTAVLMILLIIMGFDKMKSAVHILNTFTLVFNILRTLFLILYFTGSWVTFYAYFGHDYSHVSHTDMKTSLFANVWTTLEETTLLSSLSLQVYAVFRTAAFTYKIIIATVLGLLSLLLIGFRIALMILNNEAIFKKGSFTGLKWLAADEQYLLTACIVSFSAVFISKIGYAIVRRRRLGMTRFSSMQILFIVGFQTMLIPAIFSVLQFYTAVPELGSLILTTSALLLPMSTLWANASHSYGRSGSSASNDSSHRSSWLSRLLRSQEQSIDSGSSCSLKSLGTGPVSPRAPL